MMAKKLAICWMLLASVVMFVGGCASGIADSSTSQSAETVPGEKVQDDRFVPGPAPGSSGSVRW
jgi:hypothetical protein